MRLCEYAKQARSTAIYRADRWYEYPSLGLGGEIGELCGKLDECDINGARKEVGDIIWYVANTALDAGLTIEEIAFGCDTFHDIERLPVKETSPLGLAALGGKACELAKKFIRDDDGKMTNERRENVKETLGSILLALASISRQLGQFTLAEAAEENIAKLRSRKERGKLQGSGDNR